jgi:nicotinate-nucleotide adenylyltransferase
VKVGLFGGAFDPPHRGHLAVAEGVRAALELDEVRFLPYARGPHRAAAPIASDADRLAMLRLALRGRRGLLVDDREVMRGGLSYTVETLRELGRERPGDDLFLIVGSDQLEILATWRAWREVLRLARPVVVTRPGHPAAVPARVPAGRIVRVPLDVPDVCSTEVRERVLARRGIRRLVPAPVALYIEERGLYRDPTGKEHGHPD